MNPIRTHTFDGANFVWLPTVVDFIVRLKEGSGVVTVSSVGVADKFKCIDFDFRTIVMILCA